MAIVQSETMEGAIRDSNVGNMHETNVGIATHFLPSLISESLDEHEKSGPLVILKFFMLDYWICRFPYSIKRCSLHLSPHHNLARFCGLVFLQAAEVIDARGDGGAYL